MTHNSNKNVGIPAKNTEVGNPNILRVTELKFQDFGIQYFFPKLEKRCLLVCLPDINSKDLIPSTFLGIQGMNCVRLHTSNFYHKTYKSSKELQINDLWQSNIYQIGDPIFEIIDLP